VTGAVTAEVAFGAGVVTLEPLVGVLVTVLPAGARTFDTAPVAVLAAGATTLDTGAGAGFDVDAAGVEVPAAVTFDTVCTAGATALDAASVWDPEGDPAG
jgi:hypothetical protein